MRKARVFSITEYAEKALRKAEYLKDENGVVIGRVPGASGFFAQGDSFEDARANLRDVIEGNVVLALQLGLPIPEIEGVRMTEQAHA
ncbi:MAG TPA: type II toxin-antitoxin system HicB family antitoxin [candidate division WOR-3 bacterium]|uniref:Type II toxin-antitoxin system HicB family antitoxin n=1 Tax=candidate division WOR-3 bacterium TaxID=2052148 RepID=A0A7V0T586_UNCW3|nr:type II toxin-antitoxin system HicB family antitoxin [candidate division WOR-3 bacterium]